MAAVLTAFTGAMLAVSAYFFVISAFVIGVACPLCLSIDAVNIALFATAAAILWKLRAAAPPGWRLSPFVLASAVPTVAVLAALIFLQLPQDSATAAVTVEQVREEDPRFYAWYISQPLVDTPLLPPDSKQSPDKRITLVEFSDFECPHCGRAFIDLNDALSREADDINLVHRNFPLNSDCNPEIGSRVHQHACQAAVAAECAAAQGRAHEYNRLLFTNQDALDGPSLISYAVKVGLDRPEFERCMSSSAAAAAVAEDVAAGAAAGVKSTPTFFINGRRVSGGLQRPQQYRYAFAIERARLSEASGGLAPKP
jgi:protein-disulfide isomerase